MRQLQSFSNSPIKTSKIIGSNVVNARGDSLGNIREIVMDPYTGRAAYSVVALGGFLGMGEKLFAIPLSAFAYNVTKNEYVLNVSKERLEAAPGFDAEHWPAMDDEKWNSDLHSYYELLPYW